MPTWIINLGIPIVLAYALWRKYGSTPPANFAIDPQTGQPIAFDASSPTFFQQVMTFVTNLAPSQGALDFIRQTEKFSASPYRDAVGIWTIGYGHKIVSSDPYWPQGSIQTISPDEAEQLFENDVGSIAQCVRDNVNAVVSQGQFDALVSFTFNVGCSAFRSSTLLAKLNANDYAGASAEFTRWVYGTTAQGKTVIAGLVTRRLQEQATFNA